ncbi:Ger(x)C family spore germination protein [Alkalihalobacillus sp. 1P02AB]|uniref:Ger(x)C family spore germination protein n=1 Tax=Alkalihalobacillus sp. 1P02AB TaxID=3132260 RepID=UPI0039A74EA6
MKKSLKISLYFTFIVLFLSGCQTDMKEIARMNYPTAIGVDFIDGDYYLYLQLIGFNSIAKTEGDGGGPTKTYVFESRASNFIDAFFEVYETSQQKFLWAHITGIVISESVLEEGVSHIYDGISRYPEFRLTPWIFATKEPIKEVLSTVGFFGKTTLETLLHEPEQIYEQSSMIKPYKLHQFFREVFEPGFTTYIPSLAVNKDSWVENKKEEPKLELNGAYFIHKEQYKGFFTLDELKGLQWVDSETERAPIFIPDKENLNLLLVANKIEPEIIVNIENNQPQFDIELNIEGYADQRMDEQSLLSIMKDDAAQSIEKELMTLYQLGLENDVDFLNLEHILYRKRKKEWKRLSSEKWLNENTIQSVNVNVFINHSGVFKNKQIGE